MILDMFDSHDGEWKSQVLGVMVDVEVTLPGCETPFRPPLFVSLGPPGYVGDLSVNLVEMKSGGIGRTARPGIILLRGLEFTLTRTSVWTVAADRCRELRECGVIRTRLHDGPNGIERYCVLTTVGAP